MHAEVNRAERGSLALPVRAIALDAPWDWLAAGWHDLWRAPHVSLVLGIAFSLVSLAITAGLAAIGAAALVLPLAAGFMLVGPLFAVGLYEVSRRLEAGEPVALIPTLLAWRRAPTQLALMGVVLMLFFLAWVRIATLIFALFFGLETTPPPAELVNLIAFTAEGLVFLFVGTLVGAVLAWIVFMISAVAIPLILDRDTFVLSAIATSVAAVTRNPAPMLLWAFLVALFTGAGIVTAYLGMIVFFPLIGHATWHAYRAAVARENG